MSPRVVLAAPREGARAAGYALRQDRTPLRSRVGSLWVQLLTLISTCGSLLVDGWVDLRKGRRAVAGERRALRCALGDDEKGRVQFVILRADVDRMTVFGGAMRPAPTICDITALAGPCETELLSSARGVPLAFLYGGLARGVVSELRKRLASGEW